MATKNIQMIPPGYTDIVHPETNSAIVVEKTDKKFVTDAEKTKLSNLSGTNTGDETTTTLGTKINGATAKTTPVDADMLPLMDSVASNVVKKMSWENVKATLKTYFDTLYNKYVHPNHSGDVTSAGDGAQTIANKAVTLAKMADLAPGMVIGRQSAPQETGVPEALSMGALKIMLDVDKTSVYNVGEVIAGADTITDVTAEDAPQYFAMSRQTSGAPLITNVVQKVTWASIKSALKTYFDTLYNNYSHPTTAGNKHIPSGGASGQALLWSSDGTASWGSLSGDYIHPNHSGDVTSVGDGAQTIANSVVTNAKLANMAQNTIKGRITAGTGSPEDLTAANVRTIINVADGANNYVHPTTAGNKHVPSGGSSGQFLKYASDGTAAWAAHGLTASDVGALASTANAVSADKIALRGLTADLHDWIPYGSSGLFAGEGTGTINAPTTGWWRYIGWSHANPTGYITIIATSFSPGLPSYIKVCEGGIWSGWTGFAGLNSSGKVIPEQTSAQIISQETSLTLPSDAAGRFFWCYNDSTPITVTIPLHSTNPLPLGTEIEICQGGAQAVDIAVADPSIWLLSMGNLRIIAAQGGTASLKKIGYDAWVLSGALR